MNSIITFHTFIKSNKHFLIFTWITRFLLFIGFLPSGLKKILGQRFTQISIDNPVGFFFEALFQTGFYWNFLGFVQLLAGLLLLIPKTSFFGAILYFPIIINIFIIVTAMSFTGTPYIVGFMLLANVYLLFWDYTKLKSLVSIIFE